MKVAEANPFATFYDVPEGFSSITIATDLDRPWWGGNIGGYNISHIREELAFRILEKNKLLKSYRENLPPGAPVWLLLYSLPGVARGMELPHALLKYATVNDGSQAMDNELPAALREYQTKNWRFCFEFDRVFWFDALLHQFVEFQK